MVYRIGLIGYGVIAKKQHVSVIANDPDFVLTAIASRRQPEGIDGVKVHATPEALLADPDIDAVALCTPPGLHFAHAIQALAAGKHVLLEKPPTSTLGEAQVLVAQAQKAGRVLFASWHSQFNAAIQAARSILESSPLRSLEVVWHEDVNVHHPGQEWVWQPGGFGVFDAGINALSILSRLLPDPMIVAGGTMHMGPGDQMPIAVRIEGSSGPGKVTLDFDWRVNKDRRDLTIITQDGRKLFMPFSGRHLFVDGVSILEEDKNEYPRLYRRFAELLHEGRSEADLEPLRLVADAFLMCRRKD
jgi:predicted dehydrogenase